jgi:hypothetical protein
MFKAAQVTSSRLFFRASTQPTRTFTSSVTRLTTAKMDAYKKAGNRKDAPPTHDMVHFPGLMSEKRSFGDFRTVLHTGLFSQIVAMEIPVNGEIGDEVIIPPPSALSVFQLKS